MSLNLKLIRVFVRVLNAFRFSFFKSSATLNPSTIVESPPWQLLLIQNKKSFIDSKNIICNDRKLKSISDELYKRLILPFYTLIISLIASSDKGLFNSQCGNGSSNLFE